MFEFDVEIMPVDQDIVMLAISDAETTTVALHDGVTDEDIKALINTTIVRRRVRLLP